MLDLAGNGKNMEDQAATDELSAFLKTTGKFNDNIFPALAAKDREIVNRLNGKTSFADVPKSERSALRSAMYLVSESLNKLNKLGKLNDPEQKALLTEFRSKLRPMTQFIPIWVKVAVACSLGFGTMIGWKRIVVTVGEKIGKTHLTYAQGASAELVAMGTIMAADSFGLPVSTTHVLSSGIAGTMAANRSGLQAETLRNIATRLGPNTAGLCTSRCSNLLRGSIYRIQRSSYGLATHQNSRRYNSRALNSASHHS